MTGSKGTWSKFKNEARVAIDEKVNLTGAGDGVSFLLLSMAERSDTFMSRKLIMGLKDPIVYVCLNYTTEYLDVA